MKNIKIAFFDIDGTLIDLNTKRISEKILETLLRLKEKGIILCLATGRSPISLPHFERVVFDIYMTFNGSYCYHSEKTIFSNPIPAEDVRQLIQNAAEIGRPVSVATKDRLTAEKGKRSKKSWHITTLTNRKRLRSGMEIMILRCFKASAQEWPWQTVQTS